MTREELEKHKIEYLNKRFVACENLQLVKNKKNESLTNPRVFYKLIAGIIFSLTSAINIIPAIFLDNLVSQICLLIFGGLFLTAGISSIIKSISNYKYLSGEFNKNKIEQIEKYQQELKELNSQIEKINSDILLLQNKSENNKTKFNSSLDNDIHNEQSKQ